jgi:glycosyltransferase involved in cell wall biosynthesis
VIKRPLFTPLRRSLDRRFERLEREVISAQRMAQRAYEATQDWPGVLDEIRRSPDYELAYQGEPLVTVRIATYNRAELLCDRALRSVLGQTYENWEAVVVGDHCTDDTEDRIRALGDERISFLNLPFRGPYPDDPKSVWQLSGCQALNTALRLARGRWIAPLDDDDEFDPDHIEVLLRHAQKQRAEFAYGTVRVVDAETGGSVPGLARLCDYPPKEGEMNLLASLIHGGLKRFEHDPNCHLAGEVLDWNVMRRMWEAGVRFSFIEQDVGTYYFKRRKWP